ncbi:hypothetical protein Micbo1qcDRAFT_167527 [Microdochium bolleyi]|uniref:Uncharacterized protein n=1 Tax=Microdochium bolleyi TaxID=196109 RepID=A0A136IRG6_9PEZI|nr:hypothetical protein Micbo1qcDRAFT_167527 [Microdochium bolleyi]
MIGRWWSSWPWPPSDEASRPMAVRRRAALAKRPLGTLLLLASRDEAGADMVAVVALGMSACGAGCWHPTD